MTPTRLLRTALLSGALLALSLTPAHAQFGKLLKQAGKAAAAGAASDRAATAAQNPAAAPAAAPAGPRFDENVVEITPAVLDRVAAVARADAERRRFEAERSAGREARARQAEAYETCTERVQIEQEERMQGVIKQMKAAQAAGDLNRMMALGDSVRVAQERMLKEAGQKCGAAPDDSDQELRGRKLNLQYKTAVQEAGLSETQYGIIVERVLPLCQAGGGTTAVAGSGRGIFYVYTAAEVEAIGARCAALVPLLAGPQ